MNQTPLKEFEQKFESFIRLWMRYFFHIEDYILVTEILIDKKQAMLQKDMLQKDQVDGKRDRLKVLDDLYACYILDKREYIRLPDPTKLDKEKEGKDKDAKEIVKEFNKGGYPQKEKETTEQKNQRADESIVWGFDFDNLPKFKEYLAKMKDDCETQKKKNINQIEANDTKVESDREAEERLLEENRLLTQFVDKSLKLVEERLESVFEAESKTDIMKSLYHTDNYNLQLTQEKDESHTFLVANEQLKVKQYARLYSFCQQNPIFISQIKDDKEEEKTPTNADTMVVNSEKVKKKVKKN